MTTLTGTCDCGTAATREEAEGVFADIANSRPFRCPSCAAADAKRFEAEDQADQQRLDRERFGRKVQVLPVALRRHLGDLDTDGRALALEAATRWVAGDLRGIVLLGGIGVGKTTIAGAAFYDYIARHLNGATPRWMNTTLALSNLSRAFADRDRIATLDALTGKQAGLVLDDIDKCRPNVFAAEQLFCAIDLCVTHNRPLIVTTNLKPTQLAAKWPAPHGNAIASRLAGYCEMHEVTGRDRRWQA